MARKYVRDNWGRFATVGATARGAALRTPTGNKRASVKMQAAASRPAGTMQGKPKRNLTEQLRAAAAAGPPPAPPGPKPLPANRPRIRANGRPVGVVSKFVPPGKQGFVNAPPGAAVGSPERKAAALHNIKRTAQLLKNGPVAPRGLKIEQKPGQDWVAAFESVQGRQGGSYAINANSGMFPNMPKQAREQRRIGWMSTLDPRHPALHETGHALHQKRNIKGFEADYVAGPFSLVAGRVSQYAKSSEAEFVAEVYAGLRAGKLYDHKVMSAYRDAMNGPKPRRRKR